MTFDREEALRIFDTVAARPTQSDLGPVGCVLWIIALIVLIVAPRLPVMLKVPLMVLALALFVAGLVLRFFGLPRRSSQAAARARAAIDRLASLDYETHRAEWMECASVALCDAFYSGGPYMVHTYDVDAARARLGAELPRMIEFETLVRGARQIYPVFTDAAPSDAQEAP